MKEQKTWNEFRNAGMLWLANMILHLFEWEIVATINDGKVTDVYPARVAWRRFSEENNNDGYRKVTNYLKDNIDSLIADANDGSYNPITEESIDTLELSARPYNCLWRAGIRTIGDILLRDENDLIKVRNLGRHSLNEVMEKRQAIIKKFPSIPHKTSNWQPETYSRIYAEQYLSERKENVNDGERVSESDKRTEPED